MSEEISKKGTFSSIKIGLASPDMIRSWSYGEVKKPETINYRTTKPERDGLFCERIFGPTKDWECYCGKYKRVRYKGKVCEKCGVEVTTKKVRRERMGHIELAAPVSHIWYFRAIPSRMGLLLGLSPRLLEKVLYFAQYIVVDPGSTPLQQNQLLTEAEYREMYEKYEDEFRAGMGAEAIKELLQKLDLEQMAEEIKKELESMPQGQKRVRAIKRLEVIEAFRLSGNKPEWMILDVIPVIPPDIRPMVPLDGGRYATSDLNDLYRRVINRNNRLKRLAELQAPEIILRNEKRMLQEAVDSLIDNGRRGRPVTGPNNRPLKSLSEMLRGKQGRFRQNLLGKRVDYSGRSVIVVGPELKIYQCGLPKEMALELFKPFIMKQLVDKGKATNIKDAKKKVEKVTDEVWDALDVAIKGHPVLLNRAPTLHRLSIQAFEPVLVEGRAIKLHPLVCTAFNADFDGDQMPVHVPLSVEAQAEARMLMLSANNLLKPADGRAVAIPSQDMILGSYYLTLDKPGEKGEGMIFRNYEEAVMAYENGELELHAAIKIRETREINGEEITQLVDCTLGKYIFNRAIPQDLGYVDRTVPGNELAIEFSKLAGKKQIGDIINRCIKTHGLTVTATMLDEIKSLGFKYSTRAAITVAVADMTVPEAKWDIIAESTKKVEVITKHFLRGEFSEDERYNAVVDIWNKTTDAVTDALKSNLDKYNPLFMMSDSGARGSINQLRQLAGMRGLMASPTGRTIEVPIKANFREGLSILEYFSAARGARKGLADTALRTADSGYLTRRLVDVAQDVIVREDDCGSKEGLYVSAIKEGNEVIEKLKARITGRFVIGDVVDSNGNVIVPDNTMITPDLADKIDAAGIETVHVRSVLGCKSRSGVCVHCYGSDLSSGLPVSAGEAVGIVAAQSIGEPGTQLTMRTFHTGGVAGSDITQGLPRVEELFEARKPKKTAIISEVDGTVTLSLVKKNTLVTVTNDETGEVFEQLLNYGTEVVVSDGDKVVKGQALTAGYKNPGDVLRVCGIDELYKYIIEGVQRVYCLQSVDINDKHIEVIARQMTRKMTIVEAGDTALLDDMVVDCSELLAENDKIDARRAAGEEKARYAVGKAVLLGITKASLSTESFMSAASFQETTRVLTEAAIKGKVDNLIGLKENVIIGKLIPAGTGIPRYQNTEVECEDKYDIISDGQ